LRQQAERLSSPEAGALRSPPRGLSQLPLDLAQDAMSTQALVFMVFLARLQHRAAQDAMKAYSADFTEKIGQMRRWVAQVATDRADEPP